ncbi:GAF domain-containing protein [Microcoleus sp. FACHB-1515]|uniref:sensor histidine kinase n=1 Tax=Cyanophyceae TaxID=3028117 RepID=UPI001686083E|nr:GAF domain-containing protein [Microcoleus sp. FACHB-1515]
MNADSAAWKDFDASLACTEKANQLFWFDRVITPSMPELLTALTQLSSEIAQSIRRSLDFELILTTIASRIREFLNVDRVCVYRFEFDWSGTIVAESVSDPSHSILGLQIKDTFFNAQGREQYQQGRMQAIADVSEANLSPCHADLLERMHVKANLVVPIVQQTDTQERLWGLLVAHQCSAPHEWQSFEVHLLWQIAAQVSLAIQQAELYQQVTRLNAELAAQVRDRTLQLQQMQEFDALLKRISDRVRDTLDEDEILATVVHELSRALGVVCEPQLDDPTNRSRSAPGTGSTTLEQDGQPVQLCRQDQRARQSLLLCPIFNDEGLLGHLQLMRPASQQFSAIEVRLVQQVASQCAIAIRQARLDKAAQMRLHDLEQLHQQKDEFLTTVSQALRSPVCNIKMALQMLEATWQREVMPSSGEGTQRQQRYLQILNRECDREIQLLNDLLDLQRLEADLQTVSRGAIELPLWLMQVSKLFQARTQQRQQTIHLDLQPNLPILITDPTHLGRIISELLTNACKYTPPGGDIILATQADAKTVRIRVINTGNAIAPEDQAQIFDKFYRAPKSDRWQQGGTGLGLAVVKKLTLLLNGDVQVESANDCTCFTITLPR